jgi:putative hydrolase of HD superfamily
MTSVDSLLGLIIYTEGLKKELRNSWLSNGRRESVADHSWRMAMMAIVLIPRTKLDLNIEKVLKMAIIHDLAEIETGDIPTIHQTSEVIAQKSKDEDRAFLKISSMLEDMVTD